MKWIPHQLVPPGVREYYCVLYEAFHVSRGRSDTSCWWLTGIVGNVGTSFLTRKEAWNEDDSMRRV